MKISILVENRKSRPDALAVHGLSISAENDSLSLLVDVGPGEEFVRNARLLGVSLSGIRHLVLSHGHYDHGGGLTAFERENSHAAIYSGEGAFDPHFASIAGIFHFNVGIHRGTGSPDRYHTVSEDFEPQSDLLIVPLPSGFPDIRNGSLTVRQGNRHVPDDCSHEVVTLAYEKDKTFVFSPCSHNGIENIMGYLLTRGLLRGHTHVFCGMHLSDPWSRRQFPEPSIRRIAATLGEVPDTTYYTGHCTGSTAFSVLKDVLGTRLNEIRSAEVFSL